ncbi:SepM family pheromone-processing serine protease [Alteribacillus sp. YIM 98480]|uniref:SepM family pheromone-processing serine protease n=1 Tax=Alteribacillus sp. YIM 98480 TaxID=2606599 RepID=UPI00131B600C|nr:SepM family pheromone-processing serine protease [Alteribacillus sp. YIM 98480]
MARNKKPGIRRSWLLLIVLILILLVNQIPLPYFYSQPGEATALADMITVEEGFGEEGQFYLTTIRQRRANIPLYIWAQFSDYREVVPSDLYLQENETDEEYFHRQEMMMDSAQQASKMVAYEKAGFEFEVEYKGIRVTEVIEKMDASNHLQEGDLITELNGETLQTLEEMNALLEGKEAGEEVELTVQRGDQTKKETVKIDTFPEEMNAESSTGLGLLYPFTQRSVHFDPEVTIEAGAIGGPSAGLMFSLEIYNQLTEGDLTGGMDVAGTGSIDDEGNVGRIGGIAQKIVAADKSGVDIFFAPDDNIADPSNYETAVKTAEDINADMKVVPVKKFDDAVSYLESRLEEKTANETDQAS